jgi:hypothetical protein
VGKKENQPFQLSFNASLKVIRATCTAPKTGTICCCRKSSDLAGTCSGGKFDVSGAGEVYEAQTRGLNRKFRLDQVMIGGQVRPGIET